MVVVTRSSHMLRASESEEGEAATARQRPQDEEVNKSSGVSRDSRPCDNLQAVSRLEVKRIAGPHHAGGQSACFLALEEIPHVPKSSVCKLLCLRAIWKTRLRREGMLMRMQQEDSAGACSRSVGGGGGGGEGGPDAMK
eukprot:767137-Hanusia_phi.AAC.25